jgi:hypothetical protein
LLFAVCCLLSAVCCLLFAVCCLLFAASAAAGEAKPFPSLRHNFCINPPPYYHRNNRLPPHINHELSVVSSFPPHRRSVSHALPPIRIFWHFQQVQNCPANILISPHTRCRGEGLTIQDSSHDDLPQGFRIVSVDGVSILDMNQIEVRKCFPVSPADCVITISLESDLMGMNESNPVVRIPMWKEAKRVPSRSTTPLNMQQQVFFLKSNVKRHQFSCFMNRAMICQLESVGATSFPPAFLHCRS